MKERLLLLTCCAPCLAYTLEVLKNEFDVVCFNSNSNVQPYKEFVRRSEALREYCNIENIQLIEDDYRPDKWFDYITKNKDSFSTLTQDREKRCALCYEMRLIKTAELANGLNIKFFSTTLLYSIYQYHDLIKNLGESISKQYNISFLYKDFRKGWQEGFDIYKKTGLYRQNYCGCIFSENERFNK